MTLLLVAGRKDDADDAIAQALEIYRRFGPELALARCIGIQACVAERRDDFDAARVLHRDALARFRALGDERRVGAVLTNLGATEFLSGNLLEAQRCYAEALEIILRRKDVRDLAIVQGDIAINLIALDDVVGAREAGRAAMGSAISISDPTYVADVVLELACVGARSDRMDAAARLFGYASRQYASAGLPNRMRTFKPAQWLTEWLADRFGAIEFERLTSEGAAWSEKRAIEEAFKV
ncbi:MAG TPA: tetratricopeptide repeat protein [Candidatus Eremiobacteraceae bacterium]|jgi:tetratricopeptide (TPR) repeat protein